MNNQKQFHTYPLALDFCMITQLLWLRESGEIHREILGEQTRVNGPSANSQEIRCDGNFTLPKFHMVQVKIDAFLESIIFGFSSCLPLGECRGLIEIEKDLMMFFCEFWWSSSCICFWYLEGPGVRAPLDINKLDDFLFPISHQKNDFQTRDEFICMQSCWMLIVLTCYSQEKTKSSKKKQNRRKKSPFFRSRPEKSEKCCQIAGECCAWHEKSPEKKPPKNASYT